MVAAWLAVVLAVAGCSALRQAQGRTDPSAEASPTTESSASQRPFTTLADYQGQSVDWGSCADFSSPEGATTEGFECGFMLVPLDYDDITAGSVKIAVTKRPARGESVGSIVVNPGGPGASGIDFAFYDTFIISSSVVEKYDLVGFDPRGVSRSQGIDCVSDRQLDAYIAADVTPDTPAEKLELSDDLSRLAVGCSTQRPLVAHMDTVSVARDMDILRAVLAAKSLNYLGFSYGTELGAVYASLFPANVGRMVLDGAVAPGEELGSSASLVEQTKGFEVAARSFVKDCLTQSDCPLTGSVDSGMKQIAAFVDRLDVAPMPTGDEERPLTQGLAVYGVFSPLYEFDAWPLLRKGLAEAFDGDAKTLLLLADLYSQRQPDGTYRGNVLEALPAVACLDLPPKAQRPPEDRAALQRSLDEAAPTFGSFVDVTYNQCDGWPFDGVGVPEISAPGAAPILVVGTTRDPATPYAGAVALARALDSGVLVTFDGDGHTAYQQTGAACIDDIVNAFFIDGTVPPVGVRCVAQYD